MSEFSELQQPMLFELLSINETILIRQYLEGIFSFFIFIKKIMKEFSQVESKDSAQRVKGQERKV